MARKAATPKAAKPEPETKTQPDLFPDPPAEPAKPKSAKPKGQDVDPFPDLTVPKNPTMDETREFLRGLSLSMWDRGLGVRSWYAGQALNSFLRSEHYKHGDYKLVIADVGLSKTTALNCRHISENFTLNQAKTLGYMDMMREIDTGMPRWINDLAAPFKSARVTDFVSVNWRSTASWLLSTTGKLLRCISTGRSRCIRFGKKALGRAFRSGATPMNSGTEHRWKVRALARLRPRRVGFLRHGSGVQWRKGDSISAWKGPRRSSRP